MTETVHSKIGASSMYRWSKCPGSVGLSEGLPNVQSKYAEEGTRAHEIAAQVLISDAWPKDVDSETKEAVQLYVDTVLSDLLVSPGDMQVEVKFDLSELYPNLFGTADCQIYHPTEKLLRVYDYKHGQGISVEVEANPQLMYYGLGAMLRMRAPCKEVELIIVQPRCPHPKGQVRRWRFKAVEIMDFIADLVDFAKETENPNAALVPGDHCQFCPARGICPALQEKALTAAKNEFSNVGPYDPKKLSDVLKLLPVIETWVKGVREFAYGEAEHGRCPPGFKLVQKRATRKWKDEDRAAIALMESFGVKSEQIFDEAPLKSPAQVEKLLPKDKKPELARLVVAESSGLTLVEESDPREAVIKDAKSEFSLLTD